MPKADRLIAEMRAGGTHVADGEFTLDPEQARAKMRQFQLADPREYVLLLVQAAVLRGAQRLEVSVDADDLRLQCDGPPFTLGDLADLYGSLFTRRADRATAARRELALALHAVMALNPRYVTVESGDGRTGVRLELRPDAPDVLGEREGGPAGTRVHVKQRFRPGLAMAFLRDLRGGLAEERLLRERCRYASVAIDLEGQRIDGGLRVPPEAEPLAGCTVVLDDAARGLRGQAAFVAEHASRLDLVLGGVLVATHTELDDLPAHLHVVVESDRLRKDVAQADVVRDAAYDDLRGALRGAAWRVLGQVAAHAGGAERASLPACAWAVLRAAVLEIAEASGAVREAPPEVVSQLTALEVWPGVTGNLIALAALEAHSQAYGHVGWSAERFPDLPPGEGLAVLHLPEPEKPARKRLRRVFGGRFRDVTADLRAAEGRERNRRAWLARVAAPTLPADDYVLREPVTWPEGQGEVGLLGFQEGTLQLDLQAQGARLETRLLAYPRVSVRAVLAGPFTPAEDYLHARSDAALARALVALEAAIDRLWMRWTVARVPAAPAAAIDPDLLRLLLGRLADLATVGPPGQWLRRYGFSRGEAEASLAGADRPSPPELGDLRGAPDSPPPHPLACLPLVPTLSGDRCPLVEVVAAATTRGAVSVDPIRLAALLSAPAWQNAAPAELARAPGLARTELVLALTAADQERLAAIPGAGELREVTEEVGAALLEAAFLRQPEAPLTTPEGALAQVELSGDGWTGRWAIPGELLAPALSAWPPLATVRILYQGRPLARRQLPVPYGPIVGTVTSDRITPTPDLGDVQDDAALEALAEATALASVKLLDALAARVDSLLPSDQPRAQAWLLHAAAALLPLPSFHRTWERLAGTHATWTARTGAYADLLATAALADPASVADVLEQQPKPAPVKVRTCLARYHSGLEDPTTHRALVAAFRPALGALEATADRSGLVPPAAARIIVLLDLAREPITLEALQASRGQGPVATIGPDAPQRSDAGRRILRATAGEVALLDRILGPGATEPGEEWLATLKQRRAFEAQPALPDLALPAGSVLVQVAVSQGSLEGSVGLAAAPAAGEPISQLDLCTRRRVVRCLTGFSPHAIRAILNDDTLALNRSFTDVVATRDQERAWLKACADAVPTLVTRLAAQLPGLAGPAREAGWRHLLRYLSELGAASGIRGVLRARSAAAIVAFKGFTTADGRPVSVSDVAAEAKRHGAVTWIAADAPRAPAGTLPRLVLCVTEPERACLSTLLGRQLVDGRAEWATEQRVRARQATARPLVIPPGSETLVSTRLETKGLQATLWLPRTPSPDLAVAFGRDGREVATQAVSEVFPCAGVVTGTALRISESWDAVELKPAHAADLRREAGRLHELLLDRLPALDPRSPEAGLHRFFLVNALARARERERRSAGPPPPRAWTDLAGRMAALPLFPLADGRVLTLAEADAEQPAELAGLGLWAPGAEVEPRGTEAPWAELDGELREDLSVADRPLARLCRELVRLAPDAAPVVGSLRAFRVDRARRDAVFSVSPVSGEDGAGLALTVHLGHPLVAGALPRYERDRPALAFLLSALFTALDLAAEEITDAHDLTFQRTVAEASMTKEVPG
jgi:hypothetical protein